MKIVMQLLAAQKTKIIIFSIALLYVVSYSVLSSFGEYKVYYTNIDQGIYEQWCPQYVTYTSRKTSEIKSNLLGFLYRPLIIIDRKYVHQYRALLF